MDFGQQFKFFAIRLNGLCKRLKKFASVYYLFTIVFLARLTEKC